MLGPSLINHRAQTGRALLIRDSNDIEGIDFNRPRKQFCHCAVRRQHALRTGQLPARAVAADTDDGVDFRRIEQQRRFNPMITGEIRNLNRGLDAMALEQSRRFSQIAMWHAATELREHCRFSAQSPSDQVSGKFGVTLSV
jgi:hypothetical protein